MYEICIPDWYIYKSPDTTAYKSHIIYLQIIQTGIIQRPLHILIYSLYNL